LLYNSHSDYKAIVQAAGGAKALCGLHAAAVEFVTNGVGGVIKLAQHRKPPCKQPTKAPALTASMQHLSHQHRAVVPCSAHTSSSHCWVHVPDLYAFISKQSSGTVRVNLDGAVDAHVLQRTFREGGVYVSTTRYVCTIDFCTSHNLFAESELCRTSTAGNITCAVDLVAESFFAGPSESVARLIKRCGGGLSTVVDQLQAETAASKDATEQGYNAQPPSEPTASAPAVTTTQREVIHAMLQLLHQHSGCMPAPQCIDLLYNSHSDYKAIVQAAGGAKALCGLHAAAVEFVTNGVGGVIKLAQHRKPPCKHPIQTSDGKAGSQKRTQPLHGAQDVHGYTSNNIYDHFPASIMSEPSNRNMTTTAVDQLGADQEHHADWEARINDFCVSEDREMVLPISLTPADRLWAHKICDQLGLNHASIGTKRQRTVRIFKVAQFSCSQFSL
jgi:hypothetical protein